MDDFYKIYYANYYDCQYNLDMPTYPQLKVKDTLRKKDVSSLNHQCKIHQLLLTENSSNITFANKLSCMVPWDFGL